MDEEEEGDETGDTDMYVKHDRRLHGEKDTAAHPPLTTAFLKKFIQYAKNRYKCAAPPATKSTKPMQFSLRLQRLMQSWCWEAS